MHKFKFLLLWVAFFIKYSVSICTYISLVSWGCKIYQTLDTSILCRPVVLKWMVFPALVTFHYWALRWVGSIVNEHKMLYLWHFFLNYLSDIILRRNQTVMRIPLSKFYCFRISGRETNHKTFSIHGRKVLFSKCIPEISEDYSKNNMQVMEVVKKSYTKVLSFCIKSVRCQESVHQKGWANNRRTYRGHDIQYTKPTNKASPRICDGLGGKINFEPFSMLQLPVVRTSWNPLHRKSNMLGKETGKLSNH